MVQDNNSAYKDEKSVNFIVIVLHHRSVSAFDRFIYLLPIGILYYS
jgi:hypothetical protein